MKRKQNTADLKELIAMDLAQYRITAGPEPVVDPHNIETFRRWESWWLTWYRLPLQHWIDSP